MQRVAFLLQIRPGKTREYEEAHRHVWPELIREMEEFGITEYSIFRRGLQLFLYMQVQDFEEVKKKLMGSALNKRWQTAMAPLFDVDPEMTPDEPFATMEEVFYMPGDGTRNRDKVRGDE